MVVDASEQTWRTSTDIRPGLIEPFISEIFQSLVEQLQDAVSNVNEELNMTKEEREAVDKDVKRR